MSLRRFLSETIGGPRLERTESEVSPFFQSEISAFWEQLTPGGFSPRLAERVWVAERCLQMNAQAIATMPLRFYRPVKAQPLSGSGVAPRPAPPPQFGTAQPMPVMPSPEPRVEFVTSERPDPAWVANPDPVWFPNGIGDAVFAAVDSMYRWGDAFLYVTSRYADGYPSAWTVLNPEPITVEVRNGERYYRSGQSILDPANVVQISRDPKGGVRGTSALRAYASHANSMLVATDLGRTLMATSTPQTALKSQRKLSKEQAEALQSQWVSATSSRRGAPPVLPPDIDFERLGFSPADLLLLDVQTFNAQVIASAYGVPASLLNMPIAGGLNYQTPILLLEQWWRSELRPAAKRISAALSAVMLPAGSYVEFDSREFLAPSFKELVDAWGVLVDKGVATGEQAEVAVLHFSGQKIEDLATPPSAGASPAQSPNGVAKLRPTTSASG